MGSVYTRLTDLGSENRKITFTRKVHIQLEKETHYMQGCDWRERKWRKSNQPEVLIERITIQGCILQPT